MIEFDGIFILIGYAMVVATTLLYAVLGTIIWEMLESWGKLYTSCVDRKYHDNWLHSLLIASSMNGQRRNRQTTKPARTQLRSITFSGL